MFLYLLLLFIIVPLVEVTLLMKISIYIGIVNTIAMVLLTGVAGALLARTQGLMVFIKIEKDIKAGIVPTEEVLDGVLILIGGLTLLTPGFITDLFGFLLLIPYSRFFVKLFIKKEIQKRLAAAANTDHQSKYIDVEIDNDN